MCAAIVLLFAGCADELPSPSDVDPAELRVIAIRAEPPEIRPDGEAALSLVTGGFADDVDVAWTACLDPAGEDPLRCLDRTLGEGAWRAPNGLETRLVVPPDEAPRQTRSIGIVALVCRGSVGDNLHSPAICGERASVTAVKRVGLSDAPENENPAIDAVSIGGVEIPTDADGMSMDACVDPCPRYRIFVDPSDDSAQTIPGAGRREALLASFAADAGVLDPAFDDDAPFEAFWTPPPGSIDARIWIALHDDRGGVALRDVLVEAR